MTVSYLSALRQYIIITGELSLYDLFWLIRDEQ